MAACEEAGAEDEATEVWVEPEGGESDWSIREWLAEMLPPPSEMMWPESAGGDDEDQVSTGVP